jgi:hypothetical protein
MSQNEIKLTKEQKTVLDIRLEGAEIFKKKPLTKGEKEEITDSFYEEVEAAMAEAKKKVEAAAKAKAEADEKRRSMMMPHDRLNPIA